ncbi:M48 family metallopeptidase [Neptuniibacter halophilus]|uniref:M48 family metallopeptidase n=1 Tax=Neptuniibacter halophilus TaxID=651666 RepID=UPI00257465D2|nr:M48 family metallopeptidase [Neptuniibacter halophilus]
MKRCHFIRRLLPLTCLVILSGCAAPQHIAPAYSEEELSQERQTQYQLAFEYQLQQQIRLAEVSRPLLRSATDQCRSQRNSLGVLLHSIDDYPEAQRKMVAQRYNTDRRLQVLYPLSNGSVNGQLLRGDILLQVNSEKLPQDNSRRALQKLHQALQQNPSISLKVERNGQPLNLQLQAEPVCDYPVSLRNSDQINGYADGSRVIITAGMMRFAEADNQLALIIAHEIVHNSQRHISQRLSNAGLGSLLDIGLISSGIFSPMLMTGLAANLHTQDYEIEADLLALPLLQQAGYEIRGLDRFWQQMASLHPQTIDPGRERSHPTTAERALLMRKEIERLSGPFATAAEE